MLLFLAASIVAKVIRDSEIYEIRKTHKNIGSGYPSDRLTINFIRDWVLRFGEAPNFVKKILETSKTDSQGIYQDFTGSIILVLYMIIRCPNDGMILVKGLQIDNLLHRKFVIF